MEELERVKQGSFSIEDSNTLEDIEKGNYKMMPMLKVFENYFVVTADAYLENMILNGRILENRYDRDLVVFKMNLTMYLLYMKFMIKIILKLSLWKYLKIMLKLFLWKISLINEITTCKNKHYCII